MSATAHGIAAQRDRELEHRVRSALGGHHAPSLRRLEVVASHGAVTVHGRVRSFYEKQMVNRCCLDVPGVSRLHNAVEVDRIERCNAAFA